jgi:hypothetical protein
MASTQILLYNTSTGSILQFPSIGNINIQGTTYYNPTNGSESVYAFALYINETDLTGNNIETAINNLQAGSSIIFSVTGSATDGPFQGQPFETIGVEGIITSISATSPTQWRLGLSTDPSLQATIYNAQYPQNFFIEVDLYPSSSIILDPFLNASANYANSEFNPLIDNAILSRPNNNFFDVDFSSNSITAVNRNAVINASRGTGSATPSTVPASNYTTARITNPRYNGSKTTSPTGSISQLYVNQPMISGSSIGALANVEDYCNWFAYFDNISPSGLIGFNIYISGSQTFSFTGISAVHVTSLISIDGNRIDLSPSNNIIPSSSLTGALDNKLNPLTSNIPLLNSIFPSNIFSGYLGTASNDSRLDTPVSILQFSFSGSNTNAVSGSFQNYQVFSSGVAPNEGGTGSFTFQNVYGKPNETLVLLATGSFLTPNGNINGLLVPGNFNPKYTGSLLEIAQSVGFFQNT